MVDPPYLRYSSYPQQAYNLFAEIKIWDFPGGTVVRNPPAIAGDTGSIPGPGGSQRPRSG